MTETQPDEASNAEVSRVLSRRRLLALGATAGAGALATIGGGAAWAGTTKTSTGAEPAPRASSATSVPACTLSAESIEGPYYIDEQLLRRDVVEDRKGIPLTLRLRIVDSETCSPLGRVGVEIWQCDALGVYSGYQGLPADTYPGPDGHIEPIDDLTYLRGLQISDHRGDVTFRTIVPGWYPGRPVHIHTKVHTQGTVTSTGYRGGQTCHTGQLYLEEKLITAVARVAPYQANTVERVKLEDDFLYDGSGAAGGLLTLRYDRKRLRRGVVGTITLGVDPEATNNGSNSGGSAPEPSGTPAPSGSPPPSPTGSSSPAAA